MTNVNPIRPSPIAGTWYPGNPDLLREEVSGFIDQAKPAALDGKLIGIIVPHAGYRYSGPTAGYAYRALRGLSFEQVVVVSPMHDYLPYPFMTSAHRQYVTPLGAIEVDHESLEALNSHLFKHTGSKLISVANDHEHSLEIQLPFLQVALADPFTLLPLMVREQRPQALQHFGTALAETMRGKNALLVASTDLSHYYSLREANFFDNHMLEQFSTFNPTGVLKAEEDKTGFACGSGAVATVLWAAKELGAERVEILHHSTSADSTGDTTQVVGYGSAAILA